MKDRMLRKFALYESEREVCIQKIQTQMALSLARTNDAGKEVLNQWNRYVNLTYGLDAGNVQEELNLQAEYEDYRTLSPVLYKDADGTLKVKGLR